LAELVVEGDDVRHAAPFQTRPGAMCCLCLRWTPYSSASCAWVTPPASQRARISRTCSGVSMERVGGRYLTGCGVRARWRFARARRTSWYASTRAMTSRLVCAVRHAWSRRSWALARRRSMSRIGRHHTDKNRIAVLPTDRLKVAFMQRQEAQRVLAGLLLQEPRLVRLAPPHFPTHFHPPHSHSVQGQGERRLWSAGAWR